MDQNTRKKITEELKIYLNRDPSEKEIMNGQTDHYIMGRVNQRKNEEEKAILRDQIVNIKSDVDKVSAAVDISTTPLVG